MDGAQDSRSPSGERGLKYIYSVFVVSELYVAPHPGSVD